MESSLHKPILGGATDEESCGREEIVLQVGGGKRVQDDDGMKPISPNKNNITCIKQMDDQLESAKSEMNEAMEENQRLKMHLTRILSDYQILKMQYQDVIQQEAKKSTGIISNPIDTEELEFFPLGLGRSSRDMKKHKPRKISSEVQDKEGLALGLDCKFEVPKLGPNLSSKNSFEEEVKEETEGTTLKPHKNLKKNVRNGGEDEILQQNPIKRVRVSVRARCDTPTMNDGCQWRKYGQKIAKGNPCPRSYYGCTVASSCPVKKQVQRCAEDMSILITTYEWKHNHPLSTSATIMASTTSAAASMLMSGSSTSGLGPSPPSATTANINGLNFYLSDNSRSKPFYLPNSSISSSPSFPTITLDLTSNSSSSSSHLSQIANFLPRFSTTNLNFSSLDSNTLPISWTTGILSYATQALNKNQTPSSLAFGSQTNETLFQSYLQKNITNPNQQSLAPDAIAVESDKLDLKR